MVNISLYKLQLIKEKGKRYDVESKEIKSPGDAHRIIQEVFKPSEQAEEIMGLLVLNIKNRLIGAFEVSRGSLNSSIVHPREIYKRALLANAASIMVFHNHPSGDTTPSKEDINITERLAECGKVLGIELLDHIITGENDRFISLREKGVM